MNLQPLGRALNTKPVANAGLTFGSLSLVGSVYALATVVSNPDELLGLYEAVKTHHDPQHAVAILAAAVLGVIGALALSLLAAYVGKPSTIN